MAVSVAKFTVFYSWQDTRPRTTNRYFLRNALNAAKVLIESAAGSSFEVIIDEATRFMPGAPHIPDTICKKIAKADAFVGDISFIHDAGTQPRATPNPNVLIELGVAIQELGWDRMILPYNEAFGPAKGELPFDLEKHRLAPYSLSESDAKDKAKRKEAENRFASLFVDAIIAIRNSNPMRPNYLDLDAAKRQRDIDMLTRFCMCFSVRVLQDQTNHAQNGYTTDDVLTCQEQMERLLLGLDFHLYDAEADTDHDSTSCVM